MPWPWSDLVFNIFLAFSHNEYPYDIDSLVGALIENERNKGKYEKKKNIFWQ